MIVSRAPLRISFVGGGTDLPAFSREYPGRVIATAINKYVFTVINHTPLIDMVSARYSKSETVSHPSELQHNRIRAALLDMGIDRNIEIGSFASLPAKTGLGSSSSFSVALLAGLHAQLRRPLEARRLAELACRLEIELAGEPIGKQDQYAAAFGGLNFIQFNPDGTVDVNPVPLTSAQSRRFEFHILVFYTGITRAASEVLSDQVSRIGQSLDTLRCMSDSVLEFERRLLAGDIRGLGAMLDEGWRYKKSLSNKISNPAIDAMYEAGRAAGAWGGKVLGAGGGGCVLFVAPHDSHDEIRESMDRVALEFQLKDFREIPISFATRGAEVVFNAGDDRDMPFLHSARAGEKILSASLAHPE
jgi:D-glycero-alpha-D-manno-heptose-7-phosphate kinase